MSINLKSDEKPREILPEGNHLARLYSIIELGTVPVKYQEAPVRQVKLTWELPEETREFDGVQKPMVIGDDYTVSMYKEAKLRKRIEGMVGKLSDEDADNFDLHTLLGMTCLLNVVHTVSKNNGKTYANVASTAPLPKAIKEVPAQFNPNVWLDYSDEGWDETVYSNLHQWIKDKMAQSSEMKARNGFSEKSIEYPEDEIKPEDIPFD